MTEDKKEAETVYQGSPSVRTAAATTGPLVGPCIDQRYLVLSALGAGGMGSVYRARDIGLDREVAIKLISEQHTKSPDMVGRFRREAAALARVRSDHVVQVYAFGPYEDSYFFAMELIRGEALSKIIAEHRAHSTHVPVRRALTILEQAAHGLGDVHAAGIVHRDVKPSNIVIESDTGRPVLVDFGLALQRGVEEGSPTSGGTPSYMAPEIANHKVSLAMVTPQADIYAFGCTAFELLTGRPPFLSTDTIGLLFAHEHAPIPKMADLRAELAPLDPILQRALAKDPDLRYSSCRALADDLAKAGRAFRNEDRSPARARHGDARRSGDGAEAALRILVVEDDDAFRKFASRAAQIAFFKKNVEIAVVASGTEAVENAQRTLPDLVLLDYELPGMNGIDTLSRLRELPGGATTRVIVMSANVGDAERWRFSILGVTEFLKKPIGFRELIDTLMRVGERAGWLELHPDKEPSGT